MPTIFIKMVGFAYPIEIKDKLMTTRVLDPEVTNHISYLYWIYSILPNLCIEILNQAHNLNKPTRALNCLNTQNAGRSINSHNINKLQSALQQLDIEHP